MTATTLGVLGDIHLVDDTATGAAWHNAYDFDGVPDRLDRAAEAFVTADVDLVCLVGDLSHHATATDLAPLARALEQVDAPVVVVAGNHDVGGHLALLDALPDVEAADPSGWLLNDWRLAGVQVAPGAWFGARAVAAPAVEDWGDDPVLLLSHFPLLSHARQLAERGMPYPGDLLDRPTIAENLCRRQRPTVVMSGHIHARDSSNHGAVLQVVQGALVEAPYECSILELDDTTVTRRAVVLPGPPPAGITPALVPVEERFSCSAGAWRALPPAVSADSHPITALKEPS